MSLYRFWKKSLFPRKGSSNCNEFWQDDAHRPTLNPTCTRSLEFFLPRDAAMLYRGLDGS